MYSVILFESNNFAMWGNEVLKENNLSPKLMNVPRHLSSDCGYCIRIKRADKEEAIKLMTTENIEFQEIADID